MTNETPTNWSDVLASLKPHVGDYIKILTPTVRQYVREEITNAVGKIFRVEEIHTREWVPYKLEGFDLPLHLNEMQLMSVNINGIIIPLSDLTPDMLNNRPAQVPQKHVYLAYHQNQHSTPRTPYVPPPPLVLFDIEEISA